jgi:acyl dehydratase
MTTRLDAAIGRRFAPETLRYARRDTMLYALSLGYGADPLDPGELRHVYEDGLLALPTLACVLGHRSVRGMDLGIDYGKVVHAAQGLTIHRPLPVEGELTSETVIEDVVDLGADRGAVLTLLRVLRDDHDVLAESRMEILCRGDGGFGGPRRVRGATPAWPDRGADVTIVQPVLPQAALLYRLNGDDNPLHADPRAARRAGFERPILHGLATFGMAARAVLRSAGDGATLASIGGRFSAPVFPGETLRTEIWRDGDDVRFRTGVVERGIVVLDQGRAVLMRDR